VAADFDKKFTKQELCRRIAEAVKVQDSCHECAELTMKGILYTGTDGIILCARCTKEVVSYTEG
jgi:hypothetical protein